MPRNTNPRDFTGLAAERLAASKKKEAREAQANLTTITPVEIDDEYSTVPEPIGDVGPLRYENDEGEIVEVEQPVVEFRVNSDLEDMTFGAGNLHSFYVGKLYRGPKALFDHLDSIGYVYH